MSDQTLWESYEQVGLVSRERLGYSLETAARRNPHREFVLFSGERLSYAQIAAWVDRVAADLVARGVQAHDRILVQAPNRPEVAVIQFAAWRIGAIAVPVIPVYRQHEMRHIVADSRPTVLAAASAVGSRNLCAELDEVAAEIGLAPTIRYDLDPAGTQDGWDQLPARDAERAGVTLPEPADPRDCHLILYTSGTTAAPKGAELTGAGILSNCRTMARTIGVGERDVFVAGSPIAHVAGMAMGVLLPLSLGARFVLLPAWNADAAIDLIEQERATFMSSAPVFLADLVDRYEGGAGAGHRLSIYMAGGAAASPDLIRRADALGIRASRIYGMTETAGVCSMARPDDPLELRATTEGQPPYGTEIQIVDELREPLAAGETGEIRLRSPQLMLRYTDPVATENQIDAEGWFYPGDIGVLDAEGWFQMIGRFKDIINRGGEKFSAQDIEHALMSHPDVEVAAVVGAPDERLGEVVAAFVQLAPGVSWRGPEVLVAHLEERQLAKAKWPVQWHVLDEVPRSSTGKIQKNRLVAHLTDGAPAGR
ncbi:MAG TPA: class I adenylate-forming enzyme family protein [Amycolatopsis sp.]|nr:class I adenylate-forming enzyme family protein [Amycolatopsis sp.]